MYDAELHPPKTITLYGRARRRFKVFPDIWRDCLREAIEQKQWADGVKDDEVWKKGACTMSLEHLRETIAMSVRQIADRKYRYLEMRAHLGNPECWDRPARARWIKFGGRIRKPRQKSF